MSNLLIRSKYGIEPVDIIIMLTAFGTFSVSYLTYISMPIHIIYYFFQIAILFYGMLHTIKYRKYDALDFLVFLYVVVEFISTLINHGAFKELIMHVKTLLFLYAAFKWVFSWKPRAFIQVMSIYSLLLTILNTASAVLSYPKGLFYYDAFSPAFLLGGDNTSTRLYILSIVFCFLNAFYNHKNQRYGFIPMLSLVNFAVYVLVRDIGNGIVCVLVLLAAYLMFHVFGVRMPNKPMRKIITGNYILFFILVVFNGAKIFEFIIVNVLRRDLTLTTRTTIWAITMEKIAENVILGNGYVNGTQFKSFLPSIIGVNAHNTILMVAFTGGIVLSALFIRLMYKAVKQYDKAVVDPRMWFVPACFLAMFLRSQVEGGDEAYLIAMAALIVNVSRLSLSQKLEVNG